MIMSGTTRSIVRDIASPRLGAGAVVRALGSAVLRLWLAYTAWRLERWALVRLGAMSDRQLKDIGLVRSQIAFAVRQWTESNRL
jgi:uncharacterized protein YjiS (DUF1127 family)